MNELQFVCEEEHIFEWPQDVVWEAAGDCCNEVKVLDDAFEHLLWEYKGGTDHPCQ